MATGETLGAALDAAHGISCCIDVDLTKVSFLDSTTLDLLDAADRACRDQGGVLTVHGETAMVRRVFWLGRLERLLRGQSEQPSPVHGMRGAQP